MLDARTRTHCVWGMDVRVGMVQRGVSMLYAACVCGGVADDDVDGGGEVVVVVVVVVEVEVEVK